MPRYTAEELHGPQTAVEPLLLTFAQAAAQLACRPRTVRRLIAAGALERAELPNGRPRVTAASVRRLVARSIVAPKAGKRPKHPAGLPSLRRGGNSGGTEEPAHRGDA